MTCPINGLSPRQRNGAIVCNMPKRADGGESSLHIVVSLPLANYASKPFNMNNFAIFSVINLTNLCNPVVPRVNLNIQLLGVD